MGEWHYVDTDCISSLDQVHDFACDCFLRMKIAFLVVFLGCLLSACAQIKEAGRTIGHTTRDVTREIGHGTRDAAKAVGEGVKKVAQSATTEDDK